MSRNSTRGPKHHNLEWKPLQQKSSLQALAVFSYINLSYTKVFHESVPAMCSLAPFHMTSLVMDLCSRSLKTRPPVKDFLQMNVRCVFGEILESISFSVPASLLWRDPIYRLQLCLDSLWEPLLITSVQPVSVSWDGGKVVLIAHGSSDGQMLP